MTPHRYGDRGGKQWGWGFNDPPSNGGQGREMGVRAMLWGSKRKIKRGWGFSDPQQSRRKKGVVEEVKNEVGG